MTIFEIAKQYEMTAGFGGRSYKNAKGDITTDFHWGNDYATPVGVAVHAHMDCRLPLSGTYDGGEKIVVMEALDGSCNWVLGHLSDFFFKPGTVVKAGTLIARTGATGNVTGPHLHIEYATGRFRNSVTANHNAGVTLDPLPYLTGGNDEMDIKNTINALNQAAWGKPMETKLLDEKYTYIINGGSWNQLISDIFEFSPWYRSLPRILDDAYTAAGQPLDAKTKEAKGYDLGEGRLSLVDLLKSLSDTTPTDPELAEKAKKFDQSQTLFRGLRDLLS